MTEPRIGRIEIAKPQNQVWQQITTFADIPTWYDDWDRCEHDPLHANLQEGAQFRLFATRALRARVADCHIINAEAPTPRRSEESAVGHSHRHYPNTRRCGTWRALLTI